MALGTMINIEDLAAMAVEIQIGESVAIMITTMIAHWGLRGHCDGNRRWGVSGFGDGNGCWGLSSNGGIDRHWDLAAIAMEISRGDESRLS